MVPTVVDPRAYPTPGVPDQCEDPVAVECPGEEREEAVPLGVALQHEGRGPGGVELSPLSHDLIGRPLRAPVAAQVALRHAPHPRPAQDLAEDHVVEAEPFHGPPGMGIPGSDPEIGLVDRPAVRDDPVHRFSEEGGPGAPS